MKRSVLALLTLSLAAPALLGGPAAARVVNARGLWPGLAKAAENQVRDGGQTPGQIRPRPAEGRQPEFKPPTIREYKPKSTLVVPEHPIPRAKFPVIDIHSHQPTPISGPEFDRVVKGMDENNLRLLINLSGSSGARLRQGVEA